MHSAFRVGGTRRSDSRPAEAGSLAVGLRPPTVVRFTNCRLLRGHRLLTGEDLWVYDGRVANPQVLFWEQRPADVTVDCAGRILAPGYIDVQINGGFGADFSTPGPELAPGLRLVARKMLEHGVTAFLPTVVTSSPSNYREILPQILPRAASADGAAILGIHLEGPFISEDKNGCHPTNHIIVPDGERDALRRTCGSHVSHVRMVTLAPELPGALELTSELVGQGVLVSAGHSMATSAQMDAASGAGVRMCTHLFNAMPAFHPREPGIVGVLGAPKRTPAAPPAAAIESAPACFFGLIADGVHVHPASMKIAATLQPDAVVLVSDAMVAMGLPKGSYNFGQVGRVDVVDGGRAYLSGTSTLAGAVVPLDECVRRFRASTSCDVVQAIESASLHPARLLGIDAHKGSLDFGANADSPTISSWPETSPDPEPEP